MTEQTPSLRARKAQRTRTALIDAAVDLCLTRGYEGATIEAIAAAADVSPRTFARYFATKDAVFVAVLDDLADEVAEELWTLPASLGPLAAMRRALKTALARAQNRPFQSFSADRLERLIRVVTECDALRRAAIEYRGTRVVDAVAHRMGVGIEDRELVLVMTIISVTVIHAWSYMVESEAPLTPVSIGEQIDRSFAELASMAADLVVGDAAPRR